MSGPDPRIDVGLGQAVRLAADPPERAGHVVAIVLTAPWLALVRWRGATATFEALDDLVEVPHRPT